MSILNASLLLRLSGALITSAVLLAVMQWALA